VLRLTGTDLVRLDQSAGRAKLRYWQANATEARIYEWNGSRLQLLTARPIPSLTERA
jgi:hypothetical protein